MTVTCTLTSAYQLLQDKLIAQVTDSRYNVIVTGDNNQASGPPAVSSDTNHTVAMPGEHTLTKLTLIHNVVF